MTATEPLERIASAAPARGAAVPLQPALPVLLLVAGAVVSLTAAHGGYFPTSWGLSATLLLWVTGLWLVLSGRTDAGWVDGVFIGLLLALIAWIAISIAWSIVPAQSVLEVERTVLLLAGVVAVLVLARREDAPRLCGVVLGAIAAVCTYALATRLFPERLGTYDPIASYRLSSPLGYWNTLGVVAAMGSLLAVGVVADARSRWARAAAAASLVVLVVTQYYTYSRGAWIALAAGLAVLLAVSPRRLRTIASTTVVAAPVVLAVLLASRSYALTHTDVRLAESSASGHRLAVVLLLLAGTAGMLALAFEVAERHVAVPRNVRLAIGALLLALVAASVAAFFVQRGGPIAMTKDAWHSFTAGTIGGETNLNERLLNFSGNGRPQLWRAAWDEYEAHRVTGGGAGTFERTWQSRPDADFKVRDAHSLYVEALAELGPAGLVLLVAFLLVPVGAALAVRRQPLLPGVLAAYAAFVLHAGVDWDWELSGATLTALVVGCLAVVSVRQREPRIVTGALRAPAAAAVVLLSLGTIVAFLGNGSLDRAQDAVASKAYADAVADANRARQLMPWSPWPLITRGDAELAAGDARSAEESYRRAISIDSGEWRAWLGLASATSGRERRAAFLHARRLYPRSGQLRAAAVRLKVATKG